MSKLDLLPPRLRWNLGPFQTLMLGLPVLDEAFDVNDEGQHLLADVRRLLWEATKDVFPAVGPLGFPSTLQELCSTYRRMNPLGCSLTS